MALVACTGCSLGKGDRWKFASWDVRRAVGLKSDGKPDPEVPVRLVSTWTEAVHHRAGQKSERGFGGRLSFFKNGSQDPVRVDGQLVVYAFDETNRKDYETQPTRRYVFPAEQFAIHESGNELGASYSVWLPWDEIGGPQRKVSLIAKFEPKGGAAVVGEQTKHYLAGPPEPTLPAMNGPQFVETPALGGVQRASFQGDSTGAEAAEAASMVDAEPLQTTTIGLPKKLAAPSGSPFRRPPTAASQQVFTTPHMPGMATPGALSTVTTAAPPAETPASTTTPTASFPAPSTLKPGQALSGSPPLGGYRLALPPAPTTPGRR